MSYLKSLVIHELPKVDLSECKISAMGSCEFEIIINNETSNTVLYVEQLEDRVTAAVAIEQGRVRKLAKLDNVEDWQIFEHMFGLADLYEFLSGFSW